MKARGLIIGMCLLAVSCGKHASRPETAPPKKNFGVALKETGAELLDSYEPLKPAALADGQFVTMKSKDWLELSNRLMEAGAQLNGDSRDLLMNAGHNLSKTFYDLPGSHTNMTGMANPPGNPYIEAAYHFAVPMLAKKLDEAVKAVKTKVAAAATKTQVLVDDLGDKPLPEVLIQRVIDGIKDFRDNLAKERDGTADGLIDGITKAIDEKYVKDLEDLRESARMDAGRPLTMSLKRLEKSLGAMSEITEIERQRLLIEVREGWSLADRTHGVKNAGDILKILIDFWLNKDARVMYPAKLKEVFRNLSDAQILALATQNKAPLYNDADWNTLKARTDFTLIPDTQIVALFVKNNGYVIAPADYVKLQRDQLAKLRALAATPEVIALVDKISVDYPVTSIEDRINVIVNNWLGLAGRLSFPDDLRAAFQLFTDEDLDRMESVHQYVNSTAWLTATGHPKLAYARHKVLLGIEQFGAPKGVTITPAKGVENFKKFFEDKIVEATRARVINAMWPIARGLKTQLSDALMPILDQQCADKDKTADKSLKIYARYYFGKLIFGDGDLVKGSLDTDTEAQDNASIARYPLPILEKENVTVKIERDRIVDQTVPDVTGAETLGVGLINNYLRGATLEAYEGIPADARGALAWNFSGVAKMMALSGYKGPDGKLTESLHAAMTPGHFGELLEAHDYQPEKIVFAAPDVIKIKNGYKMDRASETFARASVQGQMALLDGYTRMLDFYKPWLGSTFDVGLGALRLEEAPTVKPIDKEDFFLLSLGLSSIVLKNIPVKMLGLVTKEKGLIDNASVPDTNNLNVTGAVIENFDVNSQSHQIKTADMAVAIKAIGRFLDEIGDLEKTTNPVLIDAFKDRPIPSIRDDLRKLLSGLVLFSTGKLLQADGGFARGWDGDSDVVDPGPRLLKDQLLMEEALLVAGRTLNSAFMKAKATENYFFLNQKFWNAPLGFYRQAENDFSGRVRLVDVAFAVKNVLTIKTALPEVMTQGANVESVDQHMGALVQMWLNRFLNANNLSLAAPKQVLDFSL